MPSVAADIVLFGPPKATIVDGLRAHRLTQATTLQEVADLSPEIAARVRGVGVAGLVRMDRAMFARFPMLEIVATFGVGYDHIDTGCARERGIIVTNTPDVLTEETADTALALLLLHRARSHQWRTLPARRRMAQEAVSAEQGDLARAAVGMVGMGRIGQRSRAGSKR